MLERTSGQWSVAPDRSRTDGWSSRDFEPKDGEQAEHEAESPQASQPPDRRERTTERIAKTTASRTISDMMMVASVPVDIPCSVSCQTNHISPDISKV
jgi:hypothetical protein